MTGRLEADVTLVKEGIFVVIVWELSTRKWLVTYHSARSFDGTRSTLDAILADSGVPREDARVIKAELADPGRLLLVLGIMES